MAAKQYYNITAFPLGINTVDSDRDVRPNGFIYLKNFSLNNSGMLKSAGRFRTHSTGNSGGGYVPENKWINEIGSGGTPTSQPSLDGGGGFNLHYIESDHGETYANVVTHQTSDGADADGEIIFTNPSTKEQSGFGVQSLPPRNTSTHAL